MLTSTLNALSVFPLQLEMCFVAFPPAAWRWAPSDWAGIPGPSFTAIEQLCHLRDAEIDAYLPHLLRVLSEDRPRLPALDHQRPGAAAAQGPVHADSVLGEFRSARARTVQLVAGLDEVQLQRSAEFEGVGAVTLRSLVHLLCSHDQQHLAALQWLLARYDARHLHVPSGRVDPRAAAFVSTF